MPAVTDLILALRNELAAADESVLTTDQLRGAILRAVMLVNRDFALGYVVSGDEITPVLSAADRELVLIAAVPSCCAIEIARAARQPSFKAGNLSVDRSRAVGAWRELLNSVNGQYQRLAAMDQDARAMVLTARIFERGAGMDTEVIL